jgi:hypothetical protein
MEELENRWARMWENHEWVIHWDTPPNSDSCLNMPFRFMVGPNSAQRLRVQGVIAHLGKLGELVGMNPIHSVSGGFSRFLQRGATT